MSFKYILDSLSILHASDACAERTGWFQDYIAFGDWTDDVHGPSIRFHGGTEFTGCIQNAPVMRYDLHRDCNVVYSEWMNEHNCPNAFNREYVRKIGNFVRSNLPVLLLVHNRNLDKEDALDYFEGRSDWEEMLSHIYRIPDDAYSGMLSCQNCAQLHAFCISEMIYGQEEGHSLRSNMNRLQPMFRLEDTADGVVLREYHGNSQTIRIPQGVEIIDDSVFAGHTEIKKVIFPPSLHEIGKKAFSDCTGIEVLLFPSKISFISHRAFENCTALKYVCFEPQEQADGFSMDACVFSGCVNLAEVCIPLLSDYFGNPFEDCPKLTTIDIIGEDPQKSANAIIWYYILWVGCNGTVIPRGVKKIEGRAFVNCPGIRELTIPDSVTEIDDDAFSCCPNLILLCSRGSYAEQYAQQKNIPCVVSM